MYLLETKHSQAVLERRAATHKLIHDDPHNNSRAATRIEKRFEGWTDDGKPITRYEVDSSSYSNGNALSDTMRDKYAEAIRRKVRAREMAKSMKRRALIKRRPLDPSVTQALGKISNRAKLSRDLLLNMVTHRPNVNGLASIESNELVMNDDDNRTASAIEKSIKRHGRKEDKRRYRLERAQAAKKTDQPTHSASPNQTPNIEHRAKAIPHTEAGQPVLQADNHQIDHPKQISQGINQQPGNTDVSEPNHRISGKHVAAGLLAAGGVTAAGIAAHHIYKKRQERKRREREAAERAAKSPLNRIRKIIRKGGR